MKRRFILIAMLCLLLLGSCEKYLDVKVNNGQVFITTANDCQLILDNYSVMNTGYPNDGQASSGDSFLNETSYLNESVTAEDRAIYTWNSNALRVSASPQWRNSYFIIYNANLVLEALDRIKGDGTPQTTIDNLRGSALFFRSYCLWQIAQLYAPAYDAATAGQAPGIPIRLTSDINEVSARGTVQQTYDRITADLEAAAGLMASTSSVVSRPNKVAAYAMLARVYLSMGNYTQAQINADLALQLKSTLMDYNSSEVNKSLTSNTPFARFNQEVIFQSTMISSLLTAPGAECCSFARIEPGLVNSFNDPNDLRRTVLMKQNKTNNVFDGTYRFTGNYEPNINNLFNGLAVDELYLIRAECYARSGNVGGAIADLNTLLRKRWISGTYVDLIAGTTEGALVKVLTERRKELMMRGQRWTDLRRLNKDSRFAVTLSRTVQGTTYTLPANDPRYTLLIPNEVTLNSSISQNTR